MQDAGSTFALKEWKSNWTLVLAASMGFSFYSILLSATGLFVGPLAKDFGWSRTLISSGPSIAAIITAILSPFIGALIDRFGSRRIALPGLVVVMASIAAFSLNDGSTLRWTMLWIVFGIVSGAIKSTAWTAAVLGIFNQSRGLALGLTLSGTAVAQAGVPPLVNWLIESLGWRASYVWLSLGWGGITLLLCFLFFYDARDRASKEVRAGREPEAISALKGLTPREAVRDSALWRVGISNFLVMTLTIGLMIHIFPILTEAGVTRTHAAWLMSLAGIVGIVGKLLTGYLLDRFRPNLIGGVTLGAAALAFFLLIDGVRSPPLIIVAMLVNGYAAGTKTQITGYLTAAYGGMKNFGAIYGVMAALMALAAGFGPLLAGIIYDEGRGYAPFLAIGGIGCALSGILMMSLPSYPAWKASPAPASV